jgi:hypothetical protein
MSAPLRHIFSAFPQFLEQQQSVDRDADRFRREPDLGADRVDGQRTLAEQRFENAEVRVAETCLARLQALLGASRQGLKYIPMISS